MKVKFYYSSKDKPGEQYPCNNAACLEKVKTLKSQGVRRRGDRRRRCGGCVPLLPLGPDRSARHRPGRLRHEGSARGRLRPRTTPAVLVFGDPKDRYPTDAYPRQDQGRGGLVGCEKALDDLAKELAKLPATEDEEETPP